MKEKHLWTLVAVAAAVACFASAAENATAEASAAENATAELDRSGKGWNLFIFFRWNP
jgi:hypothetical protein